MATAYEKYLDGARERHIADLEKARAPVAGKKSAYAKFQHDSLTRKIEAVKAERAVSPVAKAARKVRAKKELTLNEMSDKASKEMHKAKAPYSSLQINQSTGAVSVPSVKAHLNRSALKQLPGVSVSKVKVDSYGNASFLVSNKEGKVRKTTFERSGAMTVEDQPRDEFGRWA